MRIVTANEWQLWLAQGKVLEKDSRGPKVLLLENGQLLKIFRPRRRFWLARLQPQARRFELNAEQLLSRGLQVPRIHECFWLDKAEAVSACLYAPLPGRSLEQLYKESRADFTQRLPAFAAYIRELHQRGVYFRSLHLGNVLQLPMGGFGLIDFLDIRLSKRPLPERLIRRNLEHLRNYLRRSKITDFPWEELIEAYRASCPVAMHPHN